MSCMRCHHAHILSHSPTPSHMHMPSVTTITGSTNDTHVLSPYRLTSTQYKCQWATNPESIPTPITQLEVSVITITVSILFGQQSFLGYTMGLLHHTELFGQHRGSLTPHLYRTFGSRHGSLTPILNFRISPRVSYTQIPSL